MCSKNNPQTDWKPEPFPEPRTIPQGWDPSAFDEPNPGHDESSTPDWKPDPFPEPPAFPWDAGK